MNVLIGITSSIAAYKICELVRLYKKNNHEVKVILTPNALKFVSPLVLETLSNNKVYFEQFLPRDEVEHISLCDWADIFVVAPISANTISKCAAGICDNLLLSVFCAYAGLKKPILLAPAMNTGMWDNPVIKYNLKKLCAMGCYVVEPQEGFLACGAEGKGRLACIDLIYRHSLRLFLQDKKNNGKKMVVTLGGTKEKIDNVRYITNNSSGKMGRALCEAAFEMGFDVCAISTFDFEAPYRVIKAQSALEMLNELIQIDFDYLIMAAAVGDFRTAFESEHKISKDEVEKDENGEIVLKLILNPDVVKTIASEKRENQTIAGFCLADKNLIETAQKKLIDKNLDFIIANDVNTALDTDMNQVTIIDKSGKIINMDLCSKQETAQKILQTICKG